MSERHFLRRHWKLVVSVATFIALAVLVIAIRSQLVDTFKNLAHVNAWALLLLLPIQFLNYHSQTRLYQGLFALVGNTLRYGSMFKMALELNFVNHVFPSGGVSGISYFGVRMKNQDQDISGTRATLIQIMKLVLLVLSFEALLIVGLLCLALEDKASNFIILVTSSLTTSMIIGTIAFVFIIGSKRRIQVTFTFITRLLNALVRLVRPRSREAIKVARVEQIFEDLHNNYKIIESQWRRLLKPLMWAFMANLTEVLSIYVVYIAFSELVNPGAVILAYAVANFAGLVSVMPGGIGIYEALMTGVLVASGIPAAVSLPVTVMYRVLNTLIQLPPGWVLYHAALHHRKKDTLAT